MANKPKVKSIVSVPEVSPREQFVIDCMTWLRSYVVISEGQALVAVLWALHTWIYDRFTSTPYLQISATTKQAGKTLFMEAVGLLCQHYHGMATVRTMAIVRLIESYEGKITFGIDEAERLASNAVGDQRSMLATGYRRGSMHAVTAGPKVVEYPTFAPKMFALIGDMVGVLRDRSIQMDLERSIPTKDFNADRDQAEFDAGQLVSTWKDAILPFLTTSISVPAHLTGRDREIWTVLFSLAGMLGLSNRLHTLLIATSVDMTAAKQRAPRANHSFTEEKGAEDRIASERLIPDLIAVLGDKPYILSEDACEGLKAIPSAPWRTWRKASGLDQIALGRLLKFRGLSAKSIQIPGTREVRRGFRRADLLALLPPAGSQP